MATLIISETRDDQALLFGFQAMAVLARLVWERPYDPKLAARLHRIQCPTLLIWGESDKLVPPAYGKAYQHGIPHAKLEILPKCGHMPMFEREKEFVEAVLKFCSGE